MCVCVGGGACQLGFGIWVASQMPNQVDRGMLDSPGKNEVCDLCCGECPAVSVLTVLQLDGGARGSAQIVSCGPFVKPGGAVFLCQKLKQVCDFC